MKKFLFVFLILFLPIMYSACGSIDFTTSPGSGIFSLLGFNFNNSGTAPGAPADLQVTPIATNRLDLVWANNSNNTGGFRIERSAVTNANFIEIASGINGSETSYNDASGLNPGTTYYYRVRAYNTAGNSDYSNIASATTYSSTPLVPANPSILQAAASSGSQVSLTWHDNSDNETGFAVERRAEGEAGFAEIAGSLPVDSTAYTATGLNATATYYFRVRAYNGSGNSGYSNEAAIMICPEAPGSVTASAVSSTQINISWTDNSSNETGFRIERSTGNNIGYSEIVGTLPAGTTSYSSTGLTFNTIYYYRVRAYNAYGNSGYSNEASATTNDIIPYTPTGLTATAASSSQINLAWSDNSSNETGFMIERSGDNVTFARIETVAANVTSYNNTGLSSNTTYYYRVRACNGIGNSGYTASSAITFDVIPAAPGNLTATALSSSRIYISWSDNSSNETGFIIQRSTNNIDFSQAAAVSANVSSYSDTGLAASTTYYYRVRAHNGIGDSGYSGVAQATTYTVSTASQIIADHTIVADYDKIPAAYMTVVKKMWLSVPGESHSQAYRTGLVNLMAQNSAYSVSVQESGTPEAYTDQHLRASRASWGDYSSSSGWIYSYGEEDWYTNDTAVSRTKAFLLYCKNNGPELAAVGFGWCWDATWTNSPGGTIDPVYNVHWAGSSVNGPDGNLRWGLDSGDYSLTGNHVCMDTYLAATQAYIDYCTANGIGTRVFFTTGPVDGYTGESGFQRHLKYEYIRNYVKADTTRILFDYADILCYDDSGSQNSTSWTDSKGIVHTYPVITATNLGDGLIGHIGSAGALRLAKAEWWMLARMAGWDGN